MHLKRYEGTSMADVLRQVREELGPDALVISQRTVRRGGGLFGRLAGPIVEVTAAAEREPLHGDERDVTGRARPDDSWKDLRLARALVGPMESELRSLRGAVDRLGHQAHGGATGLLAEEIEELRRLVGTLRREAGERRSPPPDDATNALRSAGLDAGHSRALAASACAASGSEKTPDLSALVDALASRLDGRLEPPRPDDASALLYVGPPGCGKTTTLAKLAARAEGGDERPALLSTDVHRMGAEAPLRACAKVLDVPYAAAVSPEGLAESVRRFGRRPVFVNTSGRSRKDADAVPDLLRLRDALGARARVCVVLPATHKEVDLRSDLERYRALEPDEMVITKLDESRDLGSIGNLLLDEGCPPLTWIANGQRVPQDLHLAEPTDLARQILGVAA